MPTGLLARPDQPLASHLRAVAEDAEALASSFDGGKHARLAGLLHDLGKVEKEFQKRIHNERGAKEEPHAHHGAALLLQTDEVRGGPVLPVAFVINGHHAGLHDRTDLQKRAVFREKAAKAEQELIAETKAKGEAWPVTQFGPNLPDWLDCIPLATPEERAIKLRAVELYIRFLFSTLVDADRLDAERQAPETKDNYNRRHGWRFGSAGLAENGASQKLLSMLEQAIEKRKAAASANGASDDVLKVRAQVMEASASKAQSSRGVFTLTVPTGGAKTLASLKFALHHVAGQNQTQTDAHKRLRRIIVVIPYLNITQQTVRELKDVFEHSESDPVVLEHHSQAADSATDDDKAERYNPERSLRQLAAENWDAPIIVTTSVQFFDSLFSRRPADARKLHNIAQSVIIFDEVQTFPPRLMQPILDVLKELTDPKRPYGCSLVLCTATQPALLKSDDLPCGFESVTPIIEEPKPLFERLKRTRYPELERSGDVPTRSWPEVANEVLQARKQEALVVVNTRRHARALFAKLCESEQHKDAVFHLSTWMTPAHRLEVLAEVLRRLKTDKPCYLVSTQCIEAGVDVDFPAVWRAFGPYDAIVQAAGRCNRNGRLKADEALVHVFRPEDEKLPTGIYQTATSQTELLRKMSAAKPHDPDSFETYFRLLYQLSVPDECEIQHEREQLHFEQVHDRFNFIESFTAPIIVAEYELAASRVALREMCEQAARKGFLTPAEWQQVQPHIVQLDYRDKKTTKFNQAATAKLFRDADELTGLRRLTHFSAYEGGLHGCGLDVSLLGPFDNIL